MGGGDVRVHANAATARNGPTRPGVKRAATRQGWAGVSEFSPSTESLDLDPTHNRCGFAFSPDQTSPAGATPPIGDAAGGKGA